MTFRKSMRLVVVRPPLDDASYALLLLICFSPFLSISHCFSPSLNLSHCFSSFLTASHRYSLFLTVSPCLSQFFTVSQSFSPSITVSYCSSPFLTVSHGFLGKPSNRIFGKIWEFGPTRSAPPPLPQSWDAQN